MRAVSWARRPARAPIARHRGGPRDPRPARAAPPHPAVAWPGRRVLRRRRLPLAARRTSHEAARSRDGNHPYETEEAIQE